MKKTTAFLAAAMVVGAASPAMALGLKYGARLGYGIAMPDPDDTVDSAGALALGLAAQFDLAILALEADLLYMRDTFTAKKDFGGKDSVISNLAIPVLARGSFPLIPGFFSLDFGGGLEMRYLLGVTNDGKDKVAGVTLKDSYNSTAFYLPILVGATLDLKLVTANLDIRYERDLTKLNKKHVSGADDSYNHELMFMAGVFF